MKLITAGITLCLAASLCLSCFRKADYIPQNTQSLKGSGKVYFVPLGDFPAAETEKLVSYYKGKYSLSIETLPAVPLNSSVMNSERRQLIAEALINLIKSENPKLVRDRKAILIGLTAEDMYIERYNWQFSFSWRQEGRYAVVSNARMKFGEFSQNKFDSRLRKMVSKNIGIMHYGLQPSDNPRSVLYKNVGGLLELDYMGEDF